MGPNPVTGVPIRRGNLDTETHTQREDGHMIMRQRLEPSIYKTPRISGTPRARRGQEGFSPRAFRDSTALPANTLILDFLV